MLLFMSIILITAPRTILASEESTADFNFTDDLNDPATEAFLGNTEFKLGAQKAVNPGEIVSLLVQFLNLPCLLGQNLYRITFPPNKKSVIDVPAFFAYRDYVLKRRRSLFGISFFVDQTWRMYFNEECDGISAVLNICDKSILQALSSCVSCVQEIDPSFAIDPTVVFPLFRNLTTQDRQVGCMFHGDVHHDRLHLHVHVPILYGERNFYLTQQERTAIETTFNRILPPAAEEEATATCSGGTCSSGSGNGCKKTGLADDTEFQTNHMVSDKVGLGDTRLHIDYDLDHNYYYSYGLGFVATLPTAFAFKKGLIGASLENRCMPGDFSLASVMDYAINGNAAAATKLAQEFFLGALDQLAYNLLDTQLGYDHHLGLGVSLTTKGRLSAFFKRPWANVIKLHGRFIAQYYFPAPETRFFVEQKNPANYTAARFDLEKINDDPAYAAATLSFINDQLIQQFYPFRVQTLVSPGFIFQWTSRLSYAPGRWKCELVNDFWARTQERLKDLRAPTGTPPLAIEEGIRPAAYQSRIGASIAYTVERPRDAYTWSLYADSAYWSSGIGKDANIVLNFEYNF